jgi:hypothetical protein
VVAVELVAAVLIPVIGAATVVPVYLLARRVAGRPEALLAAALLALSPAHLWYSRFGFVDHHTAANLLQVSMVLAALWVLASSRVGVLPLILVITAGMLTWNGFVLYIFLLDAALLLLLLVRSGDEKRRVANLVWGSHLPAAILLTPFAAASVAQVGSPFSSVTLSWFHVAALCAFGLLGLGVRAFGDGRFRHLPWTVAVVLLALLAIQGEVPRQGIGWVLTRDPFMSRVEESMRMVHLVREQGTGPLRLSLPSSIHLLYLLFPVAWVAWLLRQRRKGFTDSSALLVLVWSGGLFLLALAQRRFMEALAPALAILVSWLLLHLRHFRRPIASGGIAVALLLAFTPWYAGWIGGARRPGTEYDSALYDSLDRFRRQVLGQATRRIPAAPGPEGPGAVNPWPLGHKILYVTGLPVVSNNFGSHIGADSYRDGSAFFATTGEEKAFELLKQRGIDYVFVDNDLESFRAGLQALGLDERLYFRWVRRPDGRREAEIQSVFLLSMFHRMIGPAGSEVTLPGASGTPIVVPALDHFRLLMAPKEDGRGRLRIFERVAGARLRISGEPGEQILVVYPLRDAMGRDRSYRKSVTVGAQGFAESVVPYPSDRDESGWSSAYRVVAGDDSLEVRVSETAVQQGDTIVVNRPSQDTSPSLSSSGG